MEVLGVAVDIGGVASAQPWVEAAGCTFRNAVDPENLLARTLDFQFTPSAFLIDERGVLVARQILFWIDRPDHAAVLEQFVAGTLEPFDVVVYDDTVPKLPVAPPQLDAERQTRYDDSIAEGVRLKSEGRVAEAAAAWRRALKLDPSNYILRSQIWMLLYPERFFPRVDYEWQDQQLQKELAEDLAGWACGPDGCWLPGQA